MNKHITTIESALEELQLRRYLVRRPDWRYPQNGRIYISPTPFVRDSLTVSEEVFAELERGGWIRLVGDDKGLYEFVKPRDAQVVRLG